jgi:outer membrane lipoprotein-sorting protein
MSLSACAAAEATVPDEASLMAYLETAVTYEAQVRITFYSNKNETEFLVRQRVDGSASEETLRYHMEILEPASFVGVTTICDGDAVIQTDPAISGSIRAKQTPVRDILLLPTFVRRYRTAGGSFMLTDDGVAVLKTELATEVTQLASAELTVRIDTMQPQTLTVLDAEGNCSLRIEYQSFDVDPTFEDGLFVIT